jgi:hypothetical protein
MPQILVGGDNQDAYSICEAIEQIGEPRGLQVVFCATPHEVLSAVSRGGATAGVLNFDKAGLTNFELACRIREAAEGRTMALLLPEMDALGDVEGTLGKQAGVFGFPVDPSAIAALACALLDAAAGVRPAPPPAGSAVPAKASTPASSRAPGALATRALGAASPEPARSSPTRADSAAPAARRKGAAQPDDLSTHTRRVRHRTWQEVRSPRREAPVEPDPKDSDEDDDAPAVRHAATRSANPKRRALLIALGVVVLSGVGYYGFRFLRPAADGEPTVTSGAAMALICAACDVREDRRVQNIHDLRCRQCGGALGFAFHCNDCKKDFALVPAEKVRTLAELSSKPECTKCKSWNCTLLPPAAAPAKAANPAPAKAAGKPPTPAAETAKKATPAPAEAPKKVAPAKPAKPEAAALDE